MPIPNCLCFPGQGGGHIPPVWFYSEAVAPYCVLIVTPFGDFEEQGPQSKVELIASQTNDTPATTMTVHTWTRKSIVAWLPATNPLAGTTDFSVKVTAQSGNTYRAWPVKVTSIGGAGGYPPTHDPTSGAVIPVLTPVNA